MINILIFAIGAVAQPADTAGLPASAQASAPKVASAADDPNNKIRCKRYTVTGTLAHVVKECHSVKEWHDLEENARRNATRYQDDGAISTWHEGN